MKKIIISLLVFSIFQLTFSQKKELKTVDKLVKSADYENALLLIDAVMNSHIIGNQLSIVNCLLSIEDCNCKQNIYSHH